MGLWTFKNLWKRGIMNVIDLMIDGFKKVYSGGNVLSKHIFMLIIIAILSITTVNVQIMADTIEKTK